MANNKNTEETPCECSKYDALIPSQLTEANLESGDYNSFTTGCSATTTRLFAPGHDAKLKSFLIAWGGLSDIEIRRTDDGVANSNSAEGHAKRYNFAHMVIEGIQRKTAKAEARVTKKANRAAARESAKAVAKAVVADMKSKGLVGSPERKLAETAGLVPSQADKDNAEFAKALADVQQEREASAEWTDTKPSVATATTAKVGRWVYEGTLTNDGVLFQFTDKKGVKRSTAKFVIIK